MARLIYSAIMSLDGYTADAADASSGGAAGEAPGRRPERVARSALTSRTPAADPPAHPGPGTARLTRKIVIMPATELRFGRAPGAWPLLGHIVALQRRPLALLDSLPAHGDLVEIRAGRRPAYVVCHPGLARQVLTDFRTFDRTGLVYERIRSAMGNGLASAGHQDHRRQRLIMQPAFRREHLRGYVAVMRQEITTAMDNWHDGAQIDLVDEMFTLTTTIALRALFSSQLDPARAERLRRALDTHSSAASTPGRSCPWQAACPPPATAGTPGPWRPGAPRSASSSTATGSPEPTAAT